MHTDAREGIRELVIELGKAENQLKSGDGHLLAASELASKLIRLAAAEAEPVQ